MVVVLKDLILYYSPAKNKYLKCKSIKRNVSQKLFVFCVCYGNNKNYAAKRPKTKIIWFVTEKNVH